MATFVLVPGAFGSPAELAPVIRTLEARGHRAISVDFSCTNPSATLDDYALAVTKAIAGIEGPVVVIGHSAGGATILLGAPPDAGRPSGPSEGSCSRAWPLNCEGGWRWHVREDVGGLTRRRQRLLVA